jgi:hypothetical protein
MLSESFYWRRNGKSRRRPPTAQYLRRRGWPRFDGSLVVPYFIYMRWVFEWCLCEIAHPPR